MKNEMIELKGGTFWMGTNNEEGFAADRETPRTKVTLEPFALSKYTITNAQFQEFFLATGYVTEAEQFGTSYVFHLLLNDEQKATARLSAGTDWWYEVPDANWRKPEGKNSTINNRMDHPVVHITWNDANAYCKWTNKRLPTEAEWEFAARGGHKDRRFPWGDELTQDHKFHANTWQGEFPFSNTKADGYLGTAPVDAFPPNDFGLYQMIGNVWEWGLNPGRIPLSQFQEKTTAEFIQENGEPSKDLYSLKGGSFLCHKSYCKRYRIAGRNSNTARSSTINTGFRVAESLKGS